MKIIICNNFVRQGSGIDCSVAIQHRALLRLGHQVRLFGPDNGVLDHAHGLAKARLLASCLYSLPARRVLRQLLSAHPYDLAYIHNTVPLLSGSIYDALREFPVVTIQHLRNYRAFCLSSYAYRDDQRCDLCVRTAFTACAALRCYRNSFLASATLTAARLIDCSHGRVNGYAAHAYIANSAFTKQEHVRHGLPESRIWVLHNASEDLTALLDPGTTVPPPHSKRITFVGSLLRAKGVYAVLDLAAHLPDWDVHFIGEGPEDAGLRRQIATRGLKNVRLLGLLEGVAKAEAWHGSFVTVVPSLWDEPFGLVVPESYSLAIPVVSTGSGGMAETIRDGTTGFIQSFRDPSETAGLLRALWEDKGRYAAMRRAARELYDAEFTEDAFTERLALLQAQILEERREATDV